MWCLSVLVLLQFLNVVTKEEIAVLILARGGSKGITLKNLQSVGGATLLSRAIKTAKEAGLEDVTVSTDNPLIALEALKSGATIFHRSRVTAVDWAPSIWGAAEFISFKPEIGVLVLLQATSPFTKSKQLRDAIKKIYYPMPYDCIFSASRSFNLRWRKSEGGIVPINFDAYRRPRRQDWDGEFIETGAFYISRRHVIENGYFQNDKETLESFTSSSHLILCDDKAKSGSEFEFRLLNS